MRIGYLHCFSGISGDMFLGALVDAGVPLELLLETAHSLNLGADLTVERVDRSGLSAVKIGVLEASHKHASDTASPPDDTDPSHSVTHSGDHAHTHGHEHPDAGGHSHTHQHPHAHSHPSDGSDHAHGRSLSTILALIKDAALAPEVKQMAITAFELLGASEAKMHNVAVEQVHFHEVGAVDAIIDIVCGCAGAFSLGVDQWVCSPLNVGSGMVRCAHGVFPVPAPATLELLQGVPIYSEGPEGERVTPTGAALLRALACSFGPMPQMTPASTGYGAGSRNPKDYPNVLRITIGDSRMPTSLSVDKTTTSGVVHGENIAVIETAIDDSTPEVIGFLMESALAAGALDVMTSSVHMKKNRPGTLVTILCEPKDSAKFCELLFRETTTIGVRTRIDQRQCLDREIVSVDTEWGPVRLKVARLNGFLVNLSPEFEDCRMIARLHHVPLKQVQSAAMLEYKNSRASGVAEAWEPGVSAHS